MELFGFGTPSELANPLGQRIKAATDNLLMGPDWSRNLEICDEISAHLENIDLAKKAIIRRLHDQDNQTVFLSLILLETCMKNCGNHFIASFDRSVMDEVVRIAKNTNKSLKASEEALRLIQQWARAFENKKSNYPIFFDTYMQLKAKGIVFPKEDVSNTNTAGAAYEPTTNQQSRTPSRDGKAIAPQPPVDATSNAAWKQYPEEDPFDKLHSDLIVVLEKNRLCREILQVSNDIQTDEALADMIGYLEACRDRMMDVIEAGTQGLLGEELFSFALKVNDSITKTLDAERNGYSIAVEDDDQDNVQEVKTSEDILLTLDSPQPPSMIYAKTSAAQDALSLGYTNNAATVNSSDIHVNIVENDPFTSNNDPFATNNQSNNPFDSNHDMTGGATNTTTASDDFDAFLLANVAAATTTTTTNVATTAPVTTNTANTGNAADDFDAFFEALGDKK